MGNHKGSSDPERQSGGEQKRNITGKMHVQGEIEVHLPPDEHKTNAAAKKKNDVFEVIKICIEAISLVALIFYATLTAMLACQAKKSADAAMTANTQSSEQFIADQRPYVLVSQIKNLQIIPGQKIRADVLLSNYGKSPALHKISYDAILFGSDAMERGAEWYFGHAPVSPPHPPTGGEMTIPPNNAACPISTAATDTNVFSCVFSTVDSKIAIPLPSQVDSIKSMDRAVVLVGRIFYQDMRGNLYTTDYCFFRLSSGAIAACPIHNDVR